MNDFNSIGSTLTNSQKESSNGWTLKNALIQNFKGISEMDVNFGSGNYVKIFGANGAGKSTIIDAITWAFGGKKAFSKIERENLVKGRKSIIRIELKNNNRKLIIERTLTDKDSMNLTIADEQGRPLKQEHLDEMFSTIAFNPLDYANLDSVEQARAIGIDTSEFDKKIKYLKQERLLIGRQKRASEDKLKACPKVDVPAKIDVQELLETKSNIEKLKNEHLVLEQNCDQDRDIIVNAELKIKELEEVLNNAKIRLDKGSKKYSEIVEKIAECPSLEEINQKLGESSTHNAQINELENQNKKHKELFDDVNNFQREYYEKESNIHKSEDAKIEYIQSQNLPDSSMSIDENGGFRIDGRLFRPGEFSTGEIIFKATSLLEHVNNHKLTDNHEIFNSIFIPNANNLDESHQELLENLAKSGTQIILELVGEDTQGDENAILIREFEVVSLPY